MWCSLPFPALWISVFMNPRGCVTTWQSRFLLGVGGRWGLKQKTSQTCGIDRTAFYHPLTLIWTRWGEGGWRICTRIIFSLQIRFTGKVQLFQLLKFSRSKVVSKKVYLQKVVFKKYKINVRSPLTHDHETFNSRSTQFCPPKTAS